MRPPLDGSILITGASAGIGEALARRMAAEARRIVLVARRRERLESLSEELTAAYPSLSVEVEACDLSDGEAREGLLARLAEREPIDVLVNNAGFGDQSLFQNGQWDRLERMLALNVVGLTHLTRGLLPSMIERGRGGVLNISSGFGLTFLPGVAVYVGTKHYVTGFTESLRAEVADQGIAVCQVCPGPVRTEFHGLTNNTTGQEAPAFSMISADQCAREALTGFRRGRALVVPGFILRNLLRLHAITPRFLWRRLARRFAGRMRAHAEARGSEER